LSTASPPLGVDRGLRAGADESPSAIARLAPGGRQGGSPTIAFSGTGTQRVSVTAEPSASDIADAMAANGSSCSVSATASILIFRPRADGPGPGSVSSESV